MERKTDGHMALKVIRFLYLLTGLALTVLGLIRQDSYVMLVAGSTLLVTPALYLVRKWFHLTGGWRMEAAIYLFSCLGWTLGGAAQMYGLLPGFDKVVHCLSGVFVSMMALAFYRLLTRRSREEDDRPAAAWFFVFFASMAVAGLFELCEFALAPIMQRDLQHVLDTGVMDTMMDMLVCLIGTLVFVLLMVRSSRGKHDFLTDAAEEFASENLQEKQPAAAEAGGTDRKDGTT